MRFISILKKTAFALLFCYVISISFYILKYNWQYARSHGFLNWVFLGEIIPSAKALVWPYFEFYSPNKNVRNVDTGKSHFSISLEKCQLGLLYLKNIKTKGESSKESANAGVQLLFEALAEGVKAKDELTSQIGEGTSNANENVENNIEFLTNYDSFYLSGLKDFAAGILSDNSALGMQGLKKIGKFFKYLDTISVPANQ